VNLTGDTFDVKIYDDLAGVSITCVCKLAASKLFTVMTL